MGRGEALVGLLAAVRAKQRRLAACTLRMQLRQRMVVVSMHAYDERLARHLFSWNLMPKGQNMTHA